MKTETLTFSDTEFATALGYIGDVKVVQKVKQWDSGFETERWIVVVGPRSGDRALAKRQLP